jgi:hypothetical protein
MSALPLKADMLSVNIDVRQVPKADVACLSIVTIRLGVLLPIVCHPKLAGM